MKRGDKYLRTFSRRFDSPEPDVRERVNAWATAIGLHKINGREPSPILLALAENHAKGLLTRRQVVRRLNCYYAAKKNLRLPDPPEKIPDKVSAAIALILNDGEFALSPEYYMSLHERIFKKILPSACKMRRLNIKKCEWILRGKSVTYPCPGKILSSLERCFMAERKFDYSGLSPQATIQHFCRFIAKVWRIHPFADGNTRTLAVFAIKYLRSLGFGVKNNMFEDDSWHFRNALVRANFADFAYRTKRDWSFLEAFFRNLVLGEDNLIKSLLMQIRVTESDRETIMSALGLEEWGNGFQKRSEESAGKIFRRNQKRKIDKILGLVKGNPSITIYGLIMATGLSPKVIKSQLDKLENKGRLRRIGPDEGGHWEVIE